jgi:hypothetical protein
MGDALQNEWDVVGHLTESCMLLMDYGKSAKQVCIRLRRVMTGCIAIGDMSWEGLSDFGSCNCAQA